MIIDVEQGSVEWLLVRMGLLTGTNWAACMGRESTREELARRKVAEMIERLCIGEAPKEIDVRALRWGKEHEQEARGLYEFETGCTVQQVGFILSYPDSLVGFSPDGLVNEDGQIEIKCPMTLHEHIKHLEEGMPKKYEAQVRGGLWVTGREWCDFISYHPHMPGKHQVYQERIHNNEPYNRLLSEAVLPVADRIRELLNNYYPEWREQYECSY